MVDPTTTNLIMAQPIRGTDVGTWDVPVNGNTGILDQAFGGVTTLVLSSAAVTLATSQAQNAVLRLTGTLLANVAITLPSIYKFWTVDNQLLNSPSSFAATLVSTSGASIIGCPPGSQDIFYDGTTLNYRNLGRIGEYWDYAASTVPTWVTASTKPPYLNCNASTFSSATYPILANLLGTTTLPDSRGRFRATLNQTTGRITSSQGGVDGDTAFASGSSQTKVIAQANLPAVNFIVNTTGVLSRTAGNPGGGSTGLGLDGNALESLTMSSCGTAASGGSGTPLSVIPPAYIGGITMIRAA